MCQRYNIRVGSPFDTTGRISFVGYGGGATTSGFSIQYPLVMRTYPTMTYSLGTGFNVNDGTAAYAVSAFAVNSATPQQISISVTQTTSITSKAASIYASSTDAYINLSAEL